MNSDIIPFIAGTLVFASSLISLRVGISVAILEILLGTIAGSFGMQPQSWMLYLANFGGIILTFMAGTEIDTKMMQAKFKECILIGFLSFFAPFIVVFIFAQFILNWSFQSSILAGIALSTTSLAVVYSVLVETGLSKSELGKLLMAATFVTDMGTALALSLVFTKPNWKSLLFVVCSIIIIVLARLFANRIFNNKKYKNKVNEPEIKFIFLLLLALIYFAKIGDGHAVLPAFILGLLMSKYFTDNKTTRQVIIRLRTVAYAIITPFFFLVGGMKVSLPAIYGALGLFVIFFLLKIISKFAGVYFVFGKYAPQGKMYSTLLMSTGLTFGTIACQFGLNEGYLDSVKYSVLLGVVIASAVIPTFIAQKWFYPMEEEDIIEYSIGNGK